MGTTYKKLNVDAIKRICKKTSILWNAEYKITFNSQNSIGSWTYSSCSAYYGDIIVISTANSERTRTITCYKGDSPAEPRWSNTITWPANNAQYTYTNFSVNLAGRVMIEKDMTITASCTRTLNSYTVTWNYLSAYPDTWTTGIQTYNYGDTPSRTNPSTVTSGLLRKVFTSWDNLGIVTGNRTITAQYQHQGKFAVKLENCIQTDGDTINGWYPYGTNCSITATANSQWAFDSNGTSTASRSDSVPASFKISPNYCNITVKGSYCTITVNGVTRDPNWAGLVPNGAEIVYTAKENYAFDSSGTTTKTVTVNGPGTYDNSPTYGYYALSLTNCQYFSGTTAGWHPLGTKPSTTVQANNGWSFGGTTANDRTTLQGNVVVPIAWKPSPKYCNITVRGSNCNIKVGNTNRDSGWTGVVALGTVITWTANSKYAFNSSGKATDTQAVINPTTYSNSPTHGYYTLDLTHCRYVSGDKAGWYALYYGRKPSTTVKADDGWAFTRDGQDTITIESTVVVPTTGRASPAYFYLTFEPKHCKSSLNSGYYESSNKPSKVTWTPDPYYSFEAGTTQKSSETSIDAIGPKTYEASPQYVRADSISVGIANADVNRNANTYYAADTVVTWTATPNHYYDASGTTTTSTNNNTKITAGATISAPNPTHIKCTISGTNCGALDPDKEGSILPDGSIIILPVGETITWTGDTGTNYKYSFSDKTENSATATATVELRLTSYKKEAPYLWYNVTSVTGTNCKAYNSNSYKQPFISGGYYLEGTKIYWKTTELPYAMTESNDTTLAVDVQPGNNDRRAVVKQYTFKLTKNTNVYSIKVWRTGSSYQGATIGSSDSPLISSVGNPSTSETKTATIYYGDTLQGIATASTGYHFDNSNITTSKQYSSGSTTANKSWSPTVSINTYTINLNLNVLPSNVTVESGNKWLSLEKKSSATQYPVGSTFNYNQTIYAIIKVQSTGGIDTVASGWEGINGGQYSTYVIGSITAEGTDSSLTITPKVILHSYNVTASSNNIGLRSTYLSTSSNATSGPQVLNVQSGTTVYGFAVLGSDVATNKVSSWNLISGTACKQGAIYRVGSKTITANTTYYINLFEESDDSSVVFKRSEAGAGSWTVKNHVIQTADNMGKIRQSGTSIYANYNDYNGNEQTILLGTFNCPSGYTVNFILTDSSGFDVPWNSWIDLEDGPYVVIAETTATYSLVGGNPVAITLPSGAQMKVKNSGTSNDPDLYFSANFDLVVVADGCHWGTYELYGRPALATIYIYNHNGYEYGWAGSGTPEAEARFIMDNYTPIGVIRYIDGNNTITVSAT